MCSDSINRKRLILILIMLSILFLPTSVLANGGPLYYSALGNGPLQFDMNSNISLVREKVTYSIMDQGNSRGSAHVTVEYELVNNNEQSSSIEMMFLTPSSQSIEVTSGAIKVSVSSASEVQLQNWQPREKTEVIEPLSKKVLDISRRGYIDPLGNTYPVFGTSFNLNFQPNETKALIIQYSDGGGMYDKSLINTVFSHLYYVTPASFWEGEPHVELIVELPSSYYQISSNPSLQQEDANTYSAEFDQLPDQEWYFSIVNTQGLLFPTNMQAEHNSYISLVIAFMITILFWIAKYYRRTIIFALGSPVILGFTIYFIRKIGGYPFNILFIGFYYILVIVILFICFFKLKKAWMPKKLEEEK